ncbi:MAG: O-antigen ligase family protein [bacterium]|nr:O-antigen ligase family protein [bacterium]
MWIIILILLIIFAGLSYKKPLLGLGIILALLPSYLIRFEFLGIPSTFLELLLLIFIFVILITRFHEIPTLKKYKQLNWYILAFSLAGIISVLISPEPVKALGLLKAFIIEPVLLFYTTILLVKKQVDLHIPILMLFWSMLVISTLGLIQYITSVGLPLRFWGGGVEVRRIVSVFEFPNALSLYLGPLIAFFSALYLGKWKLINNRLLSVGLPIVLLALFLTFSRGSWLAVFITIIFLLLAKFSWKKILPLTGIIMISLLLITPIRDRMALVTSDPSSSAHLDLMSVGFNKILENPILGNGLYGFRTTLREAGYGGEILNFPHNIFLNFWVEMGLLGLISFFAVVWFVFNQHKKQPSLISLAVLAFMSVVLIHGLVDAPYFKNDLAILFWFMVSLVLVKNSR